MQTYYKAVEIVFLLETSLLRVNKLCYLCDVEASVGGGKEHGKRRRFSVEDVCHLGLAFWLFRAGLRGPIIVRVLSTSDVRAFLKRLKAPESIRTGVRKRRFLCAWDLHNKRPRAAIRGTLDQLGPTLTNNICTLIPVGRPMERLASRLEVTDVLKVKEQENVTV